MSPRIERHTRRLRVAVITAVTLGLLITSVSFAAFAAGHATQRSASRPIAAADFSPSPSNGHAVPGTVRRPGEGRLHFALDCRGHGRDRGWIEATKSRSGQIQHVCRNRAFV